MKITLSEGPKGELLLRWIEWRGMCNPLGGEEWLNEGREGKGMCGGCPFPSGAVPFFPLTAHPQPPPPFPFSQLPLSPPVAPISVAIHHRQIDDGSLNLIRREGKKEGSFSSHRIQRKAGHFFLLAPITPSGEIECPKK
jgi:hypothetical protein